MQKKLLFVDDEPAVREVYGAMGHVLGDGHEVHTASGAAEALDLLRENRFDVVVSDLAMPEIDGVEFLAEVVKDHPEPARIIISGFADRQKVSECLAFSHRFFHKPFNLGELAQLLRRICKYNYLVENADIRRLVCGSRALPTPPETYLRLSRLLDSPHSSIEDIGAVVEQDPGLTMKLLQIVNSAQFGSAQKILTPADAVQVVGIEVLRALTLGIHVFNFYDTDPQARARCKELWGHSMRIALASREISRLEGASRAQSEEAFLGGLLHDIGKLILASCLGQRYVEVLTAAGGPEGLTQREKSTFGASHVEVGAYLLALWGLPETIIHTVEHHQSLSADDLAEFTPAKAVYAAQFADPTRPRPSGETATQFAAAHEDRLDSWSEVFAAQAGEK